MQESPENYVLDEEELETLKDDMDGFSFAAERVDWDYEWDCFKEDLQYAMDQIMDRYKWAHRGYWTAEGRNMGWRHLSGHADFRAETASEMLERVLPKTDCHITVWAEGRTSLYWRVSHHDAPTGEFYSIRHMTKQEAEEYRGY